MATYQLKSPKTGNLFPRKSRTEAAAIRFREREARREGRYCSDFAAAVNRLEVVRVSARSV